MDFPGVLLTGTVGVGKTVLATDVGAVLAEAGLSPAVIDLDWLGWLDSQNVSLSDVERLIQENLRQVWPNFLARGADHVILTRMVSDAAQIDAYRSSLEGVRLSIVRVTASPDVIDRRLTRRDVGEVLAEHRTGGPRMTKHLDAAEVEDFTIVNDERPLRQVTLELLQLLGWRAEH